MGFMLNSNSSRNFAVDNFGQLIDIISQALRGATPFTSHVSFDSRIVHFLINSIPHIPFNRRTILSKGPGGQPRVTQRPRMSLFGGLCSDHDDDRTPFLAYSKAKWSNAAGHRFFQRRFPMRLLILVFFWIACVATISISRREAGSKRWLSTRFSSTDHAALMSVTRPVDPLQHIEDSTCNIGDRYKFSKKLSGGIEGSTSVYHDTHKGVEVVIKTFSTRYHPLRNWLPADAATHTFLGHQSHWPTEIPASLLFGGFFNDSSWHNPSNTKPSRGFVPVLDYFLTSPTLSNQRYQWALVTPLLTHGTLNDLQNMVHDNAQFFHISSLDAFFRPSFTTLLSHLSSLHAHGLCHDDIKADNIFLENSTTWLLGDLGAVREVDHAWHGSFLWEHKNQWRDCRLNDVRRLLKVYLQFLREASLDDAGSLRIFDKLFLEGREEWAAMYWRFMADNDPAFGGFDLDALETKGLRLAGSKADPSLAVRLFWRAETIQAFRVSRELYPKFEDSWRFWKLRDWLVLGWWSLERSILVRD